MTKHKAGYVMVRLPEHPRARTHGYVFEHILVMEAFLDRHLMPDENVHHRNGLRADNRIEISNFGFGRSPTAYAR